MVRAMIFDFDGLVIDSETAVADAWREVFDAYGVQFPHDVWVSMVGTREHDGALHAYLCEATGLTLDAEELEARKRERAKELASKLPPLPGVVETIDDARVLGVPSAIASSSSPWWVNGHLERLGLASRFSVVCTRDDAKRSKPDPGVYLTALALLEAEPDDVVAFEDTEHGVAAAKAAGVRVVAVPGTYTEHMDFSEADVVVGSLADASLEELLRWVGLPIRPSTWPR
jgi:HAD superfamily hydrolase (TIGR01509 family)